MAYVSGVRRSIHLDINVLKCVYALVLKPQEEEVTKVEMEYQLPTKQEDPRVSLHALHGINMHPINQTMKLIGFYTKKRLSVIEYTSRFRKHPQCSRCCSGQDSRVSSVDE